ncbi:MAG: helix-turn-helix domain-containing protein, partial [Solirubrobacterales bacterium]
MTRTFENEPWRALPPEAADAIEPALPDGTREILAAIAGEVPEYQRPLEGSFGRGVRIGVDEALRQFVALVRDP